MILGSFGGTAAVATVVWLFKNFLAHRLSKDLEAHKDKLKFQSDADLEDKKAELSATIAKQNLTFTRLHDQRVEVIKETYVKLIRLKCNTEAYLKFFGDVDINSRIKKRNEVSVALDECEVYFGHTKIFLPRHIALLMERILGEMRLTSEGFTRSVLEAKEPNVSTHFYFFEKFNEDCNLLFDALEDELRKVLGENG